MSCYGFFVQDTHVAVGCDNGSLQLTNIVSGVVSLPVTSSRLQYIEAVRYNPFQASMVAGATESGMVGIWDANANKIVYEFAEHRGPATGTFKGYFLITSDFST